MKQLIVTLVSMFLVVNAFSRSIDDIVHQQEMKMKFYRYTSTYLDALALNMGFSSSIILTTAGKGIHKDVQVVQIDLIYSDFPKGVDMVQLNRQRVQKLLELRGDLVKNESIRWRLVRQMDCKSEVEAKLLFHGAVIYYRPVPSSEAELDYYGSMLPHSDSFSDEGSVFKQFKDSTIAAVFRRNKSWFCPTIVTDVTGSMSPYVSQVLLWHLLHWNDRFKTNLVLFNDGDSKTTPFKVIGSTGGIYVRSTNKYEDFLNLVKNAVSRGSGGDIPENGVEAILRAQNEFPNAKEIIYIADNYADMRDFELISNIRIPVRVVLCGAHFFVNLQYLELAKRTGGSIHTMEQDLVELTQLSEGKVFTFNKFLFTVKNGSIVAYKPT